MNKPGIIEIVYFNAGGGHVSTMEALKTELEARYPLPGWQIKPVNLQEVLKPIDLIYKGTKKLSSLRENLEEISPRLRPLPRELLTSLSLKLAARAIPSEEVYNLMLKSGETDGLSSLLFILQNFIKLMSWKIEKILKGRWEQPGNRPDLVVSVIPNFNGVMYRALRKIHPTVPYVTVMTDLIDLARPFKMPSHFWIERKQAQFLICGTDEALRQAVRAGYAEGKTVFQTSGMPLKPCFYAAPADRGKTLADLGLSADKKTVLIMFGGYGSMAAEKIVDQLNVSGLGVQSIVMCGRNDGLYARLQGKPHCCPVPFETNVARYMDVADFFIGKPGPASIFEALARGLPVMILDDKTTMPQERPNIGWVEKHGVGFGFNGFEAIADDVETMLDNLDEYRDNIAKLPKNRALYEIADILGRILNKTALPANTNMPVSGRLLLREVFPKIARAERWKKRLGRQKQKV